MERKEGVAWGQGRRRAGYRGHRQAELRGKFLVRACAKKEGHERQGRWRWSAGPFCTGCGMCMCPVTRRVHLSLHDAMTNWAVCSAIKLKMLPA